MLFNRTNIPSFQIWNEYYITLLAWLANSIRILCFHSKFILGSFDQLGQRCFSLPTRGRLQPHVPTDL